MKPEEVNPDRLSEFADGTLAHLDAQLVLLDKQLSAKGARFNKDLAMAGAALARARATAVAEFRKLEKHDRTMAKTPAQQFALIKAWLRAEAAPAQRAEIVAMLTELVEQRSVLS